MAENILHYAGCRVRINGSGILRTTFKGLDGIATQALANLTLSATPGKEPTLLSNFISQRALLRMETTAIDESFNVNRIIVFVKPLWTSFPQ